MAYLNNEWVKNLQQMKVAEKNMKHTPLLWSEDMKIIVNFLSNDSFGYFRLKFMN